jgi:TctA family transporter
VGALSDERPGLSFVSQSSVLVSMFTYIYTVYVQNIIEIVINIQYVQGLVSVQAQYSRLCPTISSFRYHGSLRHLNVRMLDRRQV